MKVHVSDPLSGVGLEIFRQSQGIEAHVTGEERSGTETGMATGDNSPGL